MPGNPIEILQSSVEKLYEDIDALVGSIEDAENEIKNKKNCVLYEQQQLRETVEYCGRQINRYEKAIADTKDLIKKYEAAIEKLKK